MTTASRPDGPIPHGGRSVRRRQALTLVLLFGGYASLYFCRADLAVGAPLLVDELTRHGLSWCSTTGVFCMAGRRFHRPDTDATLAAAI